MNRMTPIYSALLTGAAACMLAMPAAAEMDDQRSMTVSFDDLNIATEAGAARLQTRVNSAIRSVCNAGQSRDLKDIAATHRCMAEARSDIAPQLASVLDRAGRVQLTAADSIRIVGTAP